MTLDECRPGMRVLWDGGVYPPDHATIVSVQRLLHDPAQGFAEVRPDNWEQANAGRRVSQTEVVVASPSKLTRLTTQ
jgi:hypothetical protein